MGRASRPAEVGPLLLRLSRDILVPILLPPSSTLDSSAFLLPLQLHVAKSRKLSSEFRPALFSRPTNDLAQNRQSVDFSCKENLMLTRQCLVKMWDFAKRKANVQRI